MAVILYTRDGCPFSDALRASLTERGQRFTEVNLSRQPQSLPELVKLTRGRRVVPVLIEGAKLAVAPDGGTEF
ncbi:MAG TPA: glutaredoxin family protein [Candidatus Binatia bacterium]|nr:glutaredoxin family protein [Candidatus Binatia bacterium]